MREDLASGSHHHPRVLQNSAVANKMAMVFEHAYKHCPCHEQPGDAKHSNSSKRLHHMHKPKKKKKSQHTQDLGKVPEQGPRERLALWVRLASSPGPQKRQSMNTPKAYLPATRSQGVRVGRREQRGRQRANHGFPEQEDAEVLLGLRWRRKADREGTFAPSPPLVPNRDSARLPLGSLPSPSLCNSQDGVVPADGLSDGGLTLQHQPRRLTVG